MDLRSHCIETAAKRFYNRLLSEYFRSKGGDAESEGKLALLQSAMTCLDFSCLRAGYKELAGNSDALIVLTDKGGSLPGITIDGRPIDMEPCIRKIRKEVQTFHGKHHTSLSQG
ncbi:MAG: hypothetical protein AB7S75_23665 [Desulfococcaceae bacterium]